MGWVFIWLRGSLREFAMRIEMSGAALAAILLLRAPCPCRRQCCNARRDQARPGRRPAHGDHAASTKWATNATPARSGRARRSLRLAPGGATRPPGGAVYVPPPGGQAYAPPEAKSRGTSASKRSRTLATASSAACRWASPKRSNTPSSGPGALTAISWARKQAAPSLLVFAMARGCSTPRTRATNACIGRVPRSDTTWRRGLQDHGTCLDLRSPGEIYDTFGGVDGSAYLIGGVGVTFLARGHVILAPIRSGLGLRLGANIGYLKYTREPT